MKKTIVLFGLFLLLLNFAIAGPGLPHGFRGQIIIEDDSNPNGQILLGYIDGIVTAQTTIVNNEFDIVVVDYNNGGKITFSIGEEFADESFSFISLELTDTNLTFDTIPQEVGPCGDGTCDIGECSTCPIDCKLNDCAENGNCDIEVGESCSFTPEECGVCIICGDGTCNGNESCSSCSSDCGTCDTGGGGSTSNRKSSSISTSSTDEETNDSSQQPTPTTTELAGLTIEELNNPSNSGTSNKNSGLFSFITGAAIGGGIGNWMLALLFIALAVGLYFMVRKKEGKPDIKLKKKSIKKKK